jgi:hypothetical protein
LGARAVWTSRGISRSWRMDHWASRSFRCARDSPRRSPSTRRPRCRWDSAPIVLSATASSGLPVTLAVVSGPATLDGTALTVTGPGSVVVRARQAGDARYFPTSLDRTVTVTRYPQTMTWLTPATNAVVLIGQSVPLEASASSGLPVTYSVVSGPATLDQGSVVVDGAGTIVLQADQAGSDRYEPASARLVLNPIGVAELAGGGRVVGRPTGGGVGGACRGHAGLRGPGGWRPRDLRGERPDDAGAPGRLRDPGGSQWCVRRGYAGLRRRRHRWTRSDRRERPGGPPVRLGGLRYGGGAPMRCR